MNASNSTGGMTAVRQALFAHIFHVGPALALTVLLALGTGALTTFFAQDDITFLSNAAAGLPWTGLARALSSGLAFFVGFSVFGVDPFGYHLVNLLLHLLNVAGVYALALRCTLSRGAAGAASLLFGVSSIAFTPLHWASGVIELSCAAFLVTATLLFTSTESRRRSVQALSVLAASAAMLSKETAVAWPVAIGLSSAWSSWPPLRWSALVPYVAAGALFLGSLMLGALALDTSATGAYALDLSVTHGILNLATYVTWCVNLANPIRDSIALPDRGAWRLGLPLALAVLWLAVRGSGAHARPMRLGLAWWLCFLLPVLPLKHHTYLYYLYIPWIGGAIFTVAAAQVILARLPRTAGRVVGAAALLAFAAIEWRSGVMRATAVRDMLPLDRTIRDSDLLRHSLAGLAVANLPAGARVGFVNPTLRETRDTSDPGSAPEGEGFRRASYVPLEAAMRGGETLTLFFPQLEYAGFATTIPSGWTDVECFYYEQRGWLARWGTGQAALLKQAKIQLQAGQWAAADSTFRRVRALGDTLPQALEGQARALLRLHRGEAARVLLIERVRRWPERPLPIRSAR